MHSRPVFDVPLALVWSAFKCSPKIWDFFHILNIKNVLWYNKDSIFCTIYSELFIWLLILFWNAKTLSNEITIFNDTTWGLFSLVVSHFQMSWEIVSPESQKSNVATASENVPLSSRTEMTSKPRANKQSHRQRPMRPAGLRNGVELHGEVERHSSN